MLRHIIFKLTIVVFMLALLGACGGNGDNNNDQQNNNWDSMTWDQDNWS